MSKGGGGKAGGFTTIIGIVFFVIVFSAIGKACGNSNNGNTECVKSFL